MAPPRAGRARRRVRAVVSPALRGPWASCPQARIPKVGGRDDILSAVDASLKFEARFRDFAVRNYNTALSKDGALSEQPAGQEPRAVISRRRLAYEAHVLAQGAKEVVVTGIPRRVKGKLTGKYEG